LPGLPIHKGRSIIPESMNRIPAKERGVEYFNPVFITKNAVDHKRHATAGATYLIPKLLF
jgi:hypothetical protein